jgi:hypothetical protein
MTESWRVKYFLIMRRTSEGGGWEVEVNLLDEDDLVVLVDTILVDPVGVESVDQRSLFVSNPEPGLCPPHIQSSF